MKIRNVATVGTLMLAVAACGSPNAPAQKAVSGARDDVKKVAAVSEKSHKVKKAAKKQDKADRTAEKETPPADPR